MQTRSYPDMMVLTRQGGDTLESPHEKPVILPREGDMDPAKHAWCDAFFATQILAEHGLFLSLMMPEELAAEARSEAKRFHQELNSLHEEITNASPPQRSELQSFTRRVIDAVKPFIDYKARMGEEQQTGQLRSLVWPLMFDHMRREAQWYIHRLETLGRGQVEFSRAEVVGNWADLMDEEARFLAHLLDPDEFDLIQKAMQTSQVWRELERGGMGSVVSASIKEPGTVMQSISQHPSTDPVMSSALTTLDVQTDVTRGIEAARIKSIIDPRLADHNRREMVKFVDELKRAS